ncbi:MAG: hypothetical protein J0H81_14365 [Sphingopyxis terrae]|nr:hypothetical protein [Sphingopyxis terrae]
MTQMLLNRAIFLPLLLAGCAAPTDNSDQATKIDELEQRVADLEGRADAVETNQKTIAKAAAVSLQSPVAAPRDLGTDRASASARARMPNPPSRTPSRNSFQLSASRPKG